MSSSSSTSLKRAPSRNGASMISSPSDCLSDLSSLSFWREIACDNLSVDSGKLVNALAQRFPSYPSLFFNDLVDLIIISNSPQSSPSSVPIRLFADFIQKFGPSLSAAIQRSSSSLFDSNGIIYPWFHGYLGRTTAESFLKEPVDGRFLLRYSDSLADKLSISYNKKKDGKMYIKNILVHTHTDGFTLDADSDGSVTPKQSSIAKLIELNAHRFKVPVYSSLYEESKKRRSRQTSQPTNNDHQSNAYSQFDASSDSNPYDAPPPLVHASSSTGPSQPSSGYEIFDADHAISSAHAINASSMGGQGHGASQYSVFDADSIGNTNNNGGAADHSSNYQVFSE